MDVAAALQVQVSTQGVTESDKGLIDLTKSAEGAEKATNRLRDANGRFVRSGQEVATTQQRVVQETSRTENAFTRLANFVRGGLNGALARLSSHVRGVAGQLAAMAATVFGVRAIFNTLSSFENSMASVQAVMCS